MVDEIESCTPDTVKDDIESYNTQEESLEHTLLDSQNTLTQNQSLSSQETFSKKLSNSIKSKRRSSDFRNSGNGTLKFLTPKTPTQYQETDQYLKSMINMKK